MRTSLTLGDVEEFDLCSSVDVDALYPIVNGVLERHGEENSKDCRCEDAAFTYAAAHTVGVGCSMKAKAFVRSINELYNDFCYSRQLSCSWRSEKIMFIEHRPSLKAHFDSGYTRKQGSTDVLGQSEQRLSQLR